MRLFNNASLFYLHPTLSALKALNKGKASKRVALLILLLLTFAAAAFSLAATASSLSPGAAVEAQFQTGSLQFSAPEYLVGENGGSATVTVVRTGSSSGALTLVPTDDSLLSDQKAGSLLIFTAYTSLASFSNLQNTRVNITNIDTDHEAFIHLFLVDGSTCSVSDAFICLTPTQTTSFLMSDLDPGVSGYIIAVAVDASGCPAIFNGLIGDAYVKYGGIHAANLGAIAVTGLSGIVNNASCSDDTSLAQLNFDGVSYSLLPRVVAADNLPSRQNGNEMMLILDRIGGNLATGAAKLESVFGLLYDDAENVLSFAFNPNTCQFRSVISNSFPRTTPRIGQFIPAGRSGWMKLWSFDDAAIIGATINFNPSVATDSAAFNQGHNLHTLTLTNTVSVTIPVFPPAC